MPRFPLFAASLITCVGLTLPPRCRRRTCSYRKKGRATPYLYSESDIAALIAAAGMLRTSHQVATFRTLIALLAVTGMRIGEAIRLDRDDFDAINGLLIIRNTKFGKSRELPLHPSNRDCTG
jgi:integrase